MSQGLPRLGVVAEAMSFESADLWWALEFAFLGWGREADALL